MSRVPRVLGEYSYSVSLCVYLEEVVDCQARVDEEDGVLPPLQATNLTFKSETLCCAAVLHTHTHTHFSTELTRMLR